MTSLQHTTYRSDPTCKVPTIPRTGNITVKVQKCPIPGKGYSTELNPDFSKDKIIFTIFNKCGYPEYYVYMDMRNEYWMHEYNLKKASNLLGSIF